MARYTVCARYYPATVPCHAGVRTARDAPRMERVRYSVLDLHLTGDSSIYSSLNGH